MYAIRSYYVRMQTDMMYRVKTPDEWIDADETAKKDLTVYGIKDLEITNIDENKYSVKYERWFMDTKESDEIIPETGVFKVVREEIFTRITSYNVCYTKLLRTNADRYDVQSQNS